MTPNYKTLTKRLDLISFHIRQINYMIFIMIYFILNLYTIISSLEHIHNTNNPLHIIILYPLFFGGLTFINMKIIPTLFDFIERDRLLEIYENITDNYIYKGKGD